MLNVFHRIHKQQKEFVFPEIPKTNFIHIIPWPFSIYGKQKRIFAFFLFHPRIGVYMAQ